MQLCSIDWSWWPPLWPERQAYSWFNNVKIIICWCRLGTSPRSGFAWIPNQRSAGPIYTMPPLIGWSSLSVLRLTTFPGTPPRTCRSSAFPSSSQFSHLFRLRHRTSLIFWWSFWSFARKRRTFTWKDFYLMIFWKGLEFRITLAWRGRLWWSCCIGKERCILSLASLLLAFRGWSHEISNVLFLRKQ